MAATTKTEELVVAAFQLSQACPREWATFMSALDHYVADTIKKLMTAEPPVLPNYQGQAVQAQHIFNVLADCRKTVQNAEAKRNARKPETSSWPSK